MLEISTHNSLFFHVPKTAGISVSVALFKATGIKKQYPGHYPAFLALESRVDFHDCFKFCFVRNPWDRLVSAFFYLSSGGMNKNDRMRNKMYFSNFQYNFKKFVMSLPYTPFLVIPPSQYLEKEEGGVPFEALHLVQQNYWICNRDGQIIVDYLGKFETLESDFEKVCNILKIKHVSLRKKNTSKHMHYLTYYDEETFDIVAKLYSKDIQMFGY